MLDSWMPRKVIKCRLWSMSLQTTEDQIGDNYKSSNVSIKSILVCGIKTNKTDRNQRARSAYLRPLSMSESVTVFDTSKLSTHENNGVYSESKFVSSLGTKYNIYSGAPIKALGYNRRTLPPSTKRT